jgi:hypothetical protein
MQLARQRRQLSSNIIACSVSFYKTPSRKLGFALGARASIESEASGCMIRTELAEGQTWFRWGMWHWAHPRPPWRSLAACGGRWGRQRPTPKRLCAAPPYFAAGARRSRPHESSREDTLLECCSGSKLRWLFLITGVLLVAAIAAFVFWKDRLTAIGALAASVFRRKTNLQDNCVHRYPIATYSAKNPPMPQCGLEKALMRQRKCLRCTERDGPGRGAIGGSGTRPGLPFMALSPFLGNSEPTGAPAGPLPF